MIKMAILAAAAGVIATPAAADSGRATMQRASDIRSVENIARLAPRDGGAYIELAQAYRRAGRADQAAAAYREALARDNVMMVTPTGDAIWSHEVARIALARTPMLEMR